MNIKYINRLMLTWAISLAEADVEKKEEKIDFAVGGQAVIEGIMMRSPNSIIIAVRKEAGEIKVKKKQYQTLVQRYKWINVPILRGVVNLFEMMVVGTQAINFSATESLEEEEREEFDKKEEERKSTLWGRIGETLMFGLSLVLAFLFSIFLFKFLPLWITTYLEGNFSYIKDNFIVFNIIDGILKMSIFISYIFILGLIPSFRRIFEYHGAEHKSIHNYEAKEELIVDNAKKRSRFHPRCGTSFILIVFVISILVYTFVPKQDDFWMNLLVRLAFLPLIAGISYEYLKASAKHSGNKFVKLLVAPGLWFQRLTTKEPDDKQLEVGLKSLSDALAMERA